MEQLMFAEALFADLISLHPMLCSLPPVVHKQVDDYDSTIGKAIMVMWFNIRKLINLKLRNDSSKLTETQDSFKNYLIGIAHFTLSSADTLHDKIYVLSASLLEVISFHYRRGMTDYIYHAPHYWLHIFQLIDYADFCEQGGWHALKLAAKKQAEYYDKMKDLLQMQYWSEISGEASRSAFVERSKKLQAQDSAEAYSGELAEESPSNEKSEEIPKEMTVTERKLSVCEASEKKGNFISVQSPKILHVVSENLMLQTESESDTAKQLRSERHEFEKSQNNEEVKSFPEELVAHREQFSKNKDLIGVLSKDTTQTLHENSSPAERKCINEKDIIEVQLGPKQPSSDNDVTRKDTSGEKRKVNEQSSKGKEIVNEISEKSSEEKKFDYPEQKSEITEVSQARNKETSEESQQSTAEEKNITQTFIEESKKLSSSYQQLSIVRKDFCDNTPEKSKEKSDSHKNPHSETIFSGDESIHQYCYLATEQETAEKSQIGRHKNEIIKRSHDTKQDSEEVSTLQLTHIKETASEFETKVAEKKAADETKIKIAQTVLDVSEQYKLSTKQIENFETNKNEFKILVTLTEPIEQDELSIGETPEDEKSQTSKAESLEMRSGEEHRKNITVRSKADKTPCKNKETSTKSRSQAISGNAQKLSSANSSNKKVTPQSKLVTLKLIKPDVSLALHKTQSVRGDLKLEQSSCCKDKTKSETLPSLRQAQSDRKRFPKCQSSGKDEKNRRLSLPKESAETSKQLRRTNSAKAKSESKTDNSNKNLQRPGPSSSKQSNVEKCDSKTDDDSKKSHCFPSGTKSSSKPSNVQGKSARIATTASETSHCAKDSRKLYETHRHKSAQSSSESIESAKATGGQSNPRKIHSKDPKSEKPRWR